MSGLCCRFCYSSSTKLTNSLNDDVVIKFLDYCPSITISDNPSFTTNICQLCYGKAKLAADFISKVEKSQEHFKVVGLRVRSFQTPKPAAPSEILKKVQRISGISIKRVKYDDPLNDSSTERSLIKRPEPEVITIDTDEESETSDFEWPLEKNKDSDEDYKPARARKKLVLPLPPTNNIPRPANNLPRLTCAKCKQSFTNFDDLTAHVKAKNCYKEVLKCSVCNTVFPDRGRLRRHESTHNVHKIICDLCGKALSSQYDLETHLEITHNQPAKFAREFKCSECPEVLKSHLLLLNHFKMHKEANSTPRLCEICAKVCETKAKYNSHKRTHQRSNRVKKHVCHACGKTFDDNTKLKQHMHVHTGIKAFECDICDRRYAKPSSLRIHKKRDHQPTETPLKSNEALAENSDDDEK